MATAVAEVGVVTATDILKNWQGHRRLTRRVIEAFPEDKLFGFSVGGDAAVLGPGMGVHPHGGADCGGRGFGEVAGVHGNEGNYEK